MATARVDEENLAGGSYYWLFMSNLLSHAVAAIHISKTLRRYAPKKSLFVWRYSKESLQDATK